MLCRIRQSSKLPFYSVCYNLQGIMGSAGKIYRLPSSPIHHTLSMPSTLNSIEYTTGHT